MKRYIEQQGCRVVYDYILGTQDITVVLVHGYGLHGSMWIPQVDFLTKNGYPIINVDVRGHGDSRPTMEFSVKLAATDINTIINKEKPKQFILCGLSMGAFVVQEYAFLFGKAVGYMLTGVTPLCTVYPKWEKTLLGWSGSMMKYLYTWDSLKKAMSRGSTCTKTAYLSVAKMFDEIEKNEFLVSWNGFTTCLHEETFVFDAPILVVAGECDTRGTIQKHLPDWEKNYHGCSVKTIAKAGHVANLDQPDIFNKILIDFILGIDR
jgi:pimeloyl-ACP methyl ester carboxylesterase